jgi:hypothetical protein
LQFRQQCLIHRERPFEDVIVFEGLSRFTTLHHGLYDCELTTC